MKRILNGDRDAAEEHPLEKRLGAIIGEDRVNRIKAKTTRAATDTAGVTANGKPIEDLGFVYLVDDDQFCYDHGTRWGPVSDTRARQFLSFKHGIAAEVATDTLVAITERCQVSMV